MPLIPYLYILAKFVAYGLWCSYGLRLLRDLKSWPLVDGFYYGLGRLLMGFAFGFLIWLLSFSIGADATSSVSGQLIFYLCFYVPVRWIEWSIFSTILSLNRRGWLTTLWIGKDSTDRFWRLGGIAVSILADIPLVIAFGGLPSGRFIC
jgi:hypothetical protein